MVNKQLVQSRPASSTLTRLTRVIEQEPPPGRRPKTQRFPLLSTDLVDHLIKTLPIGFAYADLGMCMVRANSSFPLSCGSDAENAEGINLCNYISSDILRRFESAYRRALCGAVASDVDLTYGDFDAETSSRRTFSFYPVSEQGRVIGVAVAVANNPVIADVCIDMMPTQSSSLPSHTRSFLAEMMSALTEGKLVLCSTEQDMPARLNSVSPPIPLAPNVLGIVRRQVREAAACLNFDEVHASDFVLGVGEALDNVLVHAGHGVAEVLIDRAKSVIQVRVADVGHGIAEQIIHRAALERGYTTAGTLGHGFFLILNTCDRVWLMTSPSGTTVILEQDNIPG